MLVLLHQLPHLLASPTPFQEPRARVGELEPTDWILSTACRRLLFACLGHLRFCLLWGICSLFLWLRFPGTQPLPLGHTAYDRLRTTVAGLSGHHRRDPTASPT